MEFVVASTDAGENLDRLVARYAQVSRRIARIWISSGCVQVNRKTVRILTKPVKAGAVLRVDASAPSVEAAVSPPTTQVSAPELSIIYLDKYLVAVNKPAGLLSETDRFGGPSVESVLPNVLVGQGEKRARLWLVHRLDAGTSGVLLLARTPSAAAAMHTAFHDAQVQKTYLALCTGQLAGQVTVDQPIARVQGTRHGIRHDGKPALTRFEVVQSSPQVSLVKALPRTGRTHQIRVHLAAIDHPILGDRLYGGPGYTEAPVEPIARPMLHALGLQVTHPKSGEPLVLQAPMPEDFAGLVKRYGVMP